MNPFYKYTSFHTVIRPGTPAWFAYHWHALLLWKKIVAIIVMISLLASIIPLRAYLTRGEHYIPYAESLYRESLVDKKYSSSTLLDPMPREEAIRIAINIGGGLDFDCQGSRYLSTSIENIYECDYRSFAQKHGIVSGAYNALEFTSREEAVKSLMIASGLQTSVQTTPYIDIPGESGYISRAYEVGCVSDSPYFRPNENISRGEMFQLSDCIHTVALAATSKSPDIKKDPILSVNPEKLTYPAVVNPGINPPITSVSTVSAEITITGSSISGSTNPIIQKEIVRENTRTIEHTTERIIESTGSNLQLPRHSMSILGYDNQGILISIAIGSGIILENGILTALTSKPLTGDLPIFNAASKNPNTLPFLSNGLYPSSPLTQLQQFTGGLPSSTPSVVTIQGGSSPVNSVFGRIGSVVGSTGDYTSDLISESGSNRYFTDFRAQYALSGSLL